MANAKEKDIPQERLVGLADFSSSRKVSDHLVIYAYDQLLGGLTVSLFCAIFLFTVLFNSIHGSSLLAWFIFFLAVAVMRYLIAILFKANKPRANLKLWCNLYVFGAAFGALCWSLFAVLIFPHLNEAKQALCILVIVGVAAGAALTLSAILPAVLVFLILTLFPFIIELFTTVSWTTSLLEIALAVYLLYMIHLAIRTNTLIKNILTLRAQNLTMLQDLEYLSYHDPLTKLDNSRLFTINLTNALHRAKRNKTLVALLYIDLDKFKYVNDTYGHQVGDLLLIEIAQLFRTIIRDSDLIARLGGDEFAVIQQDVIYKETIKKTAERLCEVTRKPIQIDGYTINVTASIGIGLYPNDAEDPEILICKADNAMYCAKAAGRNRYCFSEECKPINSNRRHET